LEREMKSGGQGHGARRKNVANVNAQVSGRLLRVGVYVRGRPAIRPADPGEDPSSPFLAEAVGERVVDVQGDGDRGDWGGGPAGVVTGRF
jgi:hypothetical protein